MILELKHLHFAYDERLVINDLNFKILKPGLFHLKGLNGAGKSTLLKCVAGILKPSTGEIIVGKHQSVTYVGHQLGLHPQLTILENLEFGLQKEVVDFNDILKSAQLNRFKYVPISNLSQGQQQKVALIRAAKSAASIWLLDEPFAHLDYLSEEWFWGILNQHLTQQGTIIFTAHQKDIVQESLQTWVL